MSGTCSLCMREAEMAQMKGGGRGIPEDVLAFAKGLCRHHGAALVNLVDAYTRWADAYGGLDWKRYLTRLVALQETGRWVREVAQGLLKVSREPDRGRVVISR